jgi:NAD-dependent deacetylase
MDLNRILIFTGAGISAESGVSTFRDKDGVWSKYDLNEVCNFNRFVSIKNDVEKRAKIFDFYNETKKKMLIAKPNEAHYQVAEWQKKYGKDKVVIVTANIDDLFEKAGCEDVIHVHGDIFNMMCASCSYTWHIGDNEFSDVRCPECNSRLTKPNIVFFYENAPKYAEMKYHFHPKRRNANDHLLYIGSSMTVIPPSTLFSNGDRNNIGHKILINKDVGIEDYLFKHKFYGNATEKIKEVNELFFK